MHSFFINNIWGADFADIQLISKINKAIHFLLCVFDIYGKCKLVVPLKDKKDITITNDFQKILKESGRKPNKVWADTFNEFYNR